MVLETTPREDDGVGAPLEADPAIVEAVEQADTEASAEVMSLLSQHVPLALLADLASVQGPASPEILQDEGLPEVAWWEGEHGEDAAAHAPEHQEPEPAEGQTGRTGGPTES